MATLAQLGDRARRKMGLGLGSHTVTLSYSDIADQGTVTVHGIVLTVFTGSPVTEKAQFKKETNASATSDNLEDLIDAIFDGTTGVSASSSSGVTTITGARSVTTDNTTGFVISSSTYQDEPPYTSDFDQWVLDGELDVADKVSNRALQAGDTGLMEVFPLTGDGSAVAIAKPANLLRPTEVRAKIGSDAALYRLIRLSPAEMLHVRQNDHSYYKVDSADKAQKYWSMWDDKVQFSAPPITGAGMAEIIGIKTPQTTKTTESELPAHIQPLVEDYTVFHAYAQMQRNDLAGFHYQKYIADIGAINRTYGA